jgi:hypothetical protein
MRRGLLLARDAETAAWFLEHYHRGKLAGWWDNPHMCGTITGLERKTVENIVLGKTKSFQGGSATNFQAYREKVERLTALGLAPGPDGRFTPDALAAAGVSDPAERLAVGPVEELLAAITIAIRQGEMAKGEAVDVVRRLHPAFDVQGQHLARMWLDLSTADST